MHSSIISTILLFGLIGFARAQEERTVVLRILAEGKPAAGAKVWVYAQGDAKTEPAPLIADAGGKAIAKMNPGQFFAYAYARDSQGRLSQDFLRLNHIGAPLEVDLALLDIVKRSGRVTDAQGKPIVGAEIVPTQFSRLHDANGGDDRISRNISLPEWESPRLAARTDKDGRFVVGAPKGYGVSFTVKAMQFGETKFRIIGDGPAEVKLVPPGAVVLRFSGIEDIEKLKGVSFQLQPKNEAKKTEPGTTQAIRFNCGQLNGEREFVIANVLPGRSGLRIWHNPKLPVLLACLAGSMCFSC
jgi:hypothetical protein